MANELSIKYSTAWAIIKRATAADGVVVQRRGGTGPNRVRVNDNIKECALRVVEQHPEFTLAQINANIRAEIPGEPHILISSLSNLLKSHLITLKKLEDVPADRNSDRVKEGRYEFAHWLFATGVHNELIFVDESGFNLWTKRSQRRAVRGTPAARVVGRRRGPSLTMTFAVSNTHGLLHHDLQQGGMTAANFNQFLEAVRNKVPADNTQRTILFDNCRAHLQEEQANLGPFLTIRRIPPYSPMLNIVENCFAQWKAAAKNQLAEIRHQQLCLPFNEQMANLAQIGEQNVGVITPQNAINYFRKLQGYLPACLNRENINM